MDSIKFANLIDKSMTNGYSSFCFVIGGSYGVSEDLRKREIKMEKIEKILADIDTLTVIELADLVKAIEEKSGGRFQLPLGTLYPVLYRFLENGYLSDRDEIVNKRLRKYYHLEKKGEEFYEAALAEYRKISEGVNMITQGGGTE